MSFFDNDILLEGIAAKKIYQQIKDLPIIDYHCHLNQKDIANDIPLNNIGQLWLAADHYKWRAMRMCGVDEYYITGNASWYDKFLKYASILPNLIGNPLYYWTHLELKLIFDINEPLNVLTAEKIYKEANDKINDLTVRKLLKQFKVEYIATTDNPFDDLSWHQKYNDTEVMPTFRPDKILEFNKEAIIKLANFTGIEINSYIDLKKALFNSLEIFIKKGCKISDHGFYDFPKNYLSDIDAEKVYCNYNNASDIDKDGLFGNLLLSLMKEYKKHDLIVQLHFSVVRNINQEMFIKTGIDSGFDVIGAECNYQNLRLLLNSLNNDERPSIILYSLNPNAFIPLANLSGAFKNIYIGAPWWHNDTLNGIKHYLSIISEYACLGTNLGMLTDSRSYLSYSRFDFFRRIVATFLGEKVDKGECLEEDALRLAEKICYYNIKSLLKK